MQKKAETLSRILFCTCLFLTQLFLDCHTVRLNPGWHAARSFSFHSVRV